MLVEKKFCNSLQLKNAVIIIIIIIIIIIPSNPVNTDTEGPYKVSVLKRCPYQMG